VEAGAGEPPVVLEAVMNNGAASWQRVMPLLAPHVRVAAYDRAGIGGSDPAPGLVTIDRQIGDLASVITGLGAGPCVLAGHSWGGVLVQLLAFRRPDLAAGKLLGLGTGRRLGEQQEIFFAGQRQVREVCFLAGSGAGAHASPSASA
jgi:pimeloyl-ACP methyl ester carboxylesterase